MSGTDYINGQGLSGLPFCLTSNDGTITIKKGVTANGKETFDLSSGITLSDFPDGSIPASAIDGCPGGCGETGQGNVGSVANPYVGFSGSVYVQPASNGLLHFGGSGANGGQLQMYDGTCWCDAAEQLGGLTPGSVFTDGNNSWQLISTTGTPGEVGYSEDWEQIVLNAGGGVSVFNARGTVCQQRPLGINGDGRPTWTASEVAEGIPTGYVNWNGTKWERWNGTAWEDAIVKAPGFFWAEGVCQENGDVDYCVLYTLCPKEGDCPTDGESAIPVATNVAIKVRGSADFVWLEYVDGALCVQVNWANVDADVLANDPEFCAALITKLVANQDFITRLTAALSSTYVTQTNIDNSLTAFLDDARLKAAIQACIDDQSGGGSEARTDEEINTLIKACLADNAGGETTTVGGGSFTCFPSGLALWQRPFQVGEDQTISIPHPSQFDTVLAVWLEGGANDNALNQADNGPYILNNLVGPSQIVNPVEQTADGNIYILGTCTPDFGQGGGDPGGGDPTGPLTTDPNPATCVLYAEDDTTPPTQVRECSFFGDGVSDITCGDVVVNGGMFEYRQQGGSVIDGVLTLSGVNHQSITNITISSACATDTNMAYTPRTGQSSIMDVPPAQSTDINAHLNCASGYTISIICA